jgi:6-phosphogluconolactonase/glucosamine-6-phosphate isomerase/deaminase
VHVVLFSAITYQLATKIKWKKSFLFVMGEYVVGSSSDPVKMEPIIRQHGQEQHSIFKVSIIYVLQKHTVYYYGTGKLSKLDI